MVSLRRPGTFLAVLTLIISSLALSASTWIAQPQATLAADQPDLTVSVAISGDTSKICIGSTVHFTATVTNQGQAASGAITVGVQIDTLSVTKTFGSLGPGESSSQSQDWPNVTAGHHTVTLTVDPNNQIAESNESNNSASVSFDAVDCSQNPPPATCTATGGSWSVAPQQVMVGNQVTITGSGANNQAWQQGTTVAFTLKDANGASFSLGQATVSCVNNQPSLSLTATIPANAAAGNATIQAQDSNGGTSTAALVITASNSGGNNPPPSQETVTVRVPAFCFKLSLDQASLVGTECASATLNGQAGTKLDAHSFEFKNVAVNTTAALRIFPQDGNNNRYCDSSLGITPQSGGVQTFTNAAACAYTNNGVVHSIQDAFQVLKPWQRTDSVVANGTTVRTWMWGPEFFQQPMAEPYAEATDQNGKSANSVSGPYRFVVYFDKSRMEITHPEGDPSNVWYITNGLLAKELVTGNVQLGDNTFQQHEPAQVNAAGDPNDPNAPTYASFNKVLTYQPIPSGWTITQTIDRNGTVGNDGSLGQYNVTAQDVGAPTHHTVASVFWDFMNSSGLVSQDGQNVNAKLFENPFYATGYPLTEPYWAQVKVNGVTKWVLTQVFERRVLTYTPDNPDGWKVEAGNVGQHYYRWRYEQGQ